MGLMDRDYMQARPNAFGGEARRRPGSRSRQGLRWMMVLLGALAAAWWTQAPSRRQQVLAAQPQEATPVQRALPFPESGDAVWYVIPTQPKIALLKLHAPQTPGRHFVVRLDDWQTNVPQVLIPVRAGESAAILLPLGRYRLRIATGSTWYGLDQMFGLRSRVTEAVTPISFTLQQGQVLSHWVDLEQNSGGNLEMRPSHM